MFEYLEDQAKMDMNADESLVRTIQTRGKAYCPVKNLITQGCFGSDLQLKKEILPAERLSDFL